MPEIEAKKLSGQHIGKNLVANNGTWEILDVKHSADGMVSLFIRRLDELNGAIAIAPNLFAENKVTVEPAPLEPSAKDAATELSKVEGIHHIHGHECLCGFNSAVSRDRTKHIMDETLKAIGWRAP